MSVLKSAVVSKGAWTTPAQFALRVILYISIQRNSGHSVDQSRTYFSLEYRLTVKLGKLW